MLFIVNIWVLIPRASIFVEDVFVLLITPLLINKAWAIPNKSNLLGIMVLIVLTIMSVVPIF